MTERARIKSEIAKLGHLDEVRIDIHEYSCMVARVHSTYVIHCIDESDDLLYEATLREYDIDVVVDWLFA